MNVIDSNKRLWVLLGAVLVIGSGAVFHGQGLRTSALNDPVALLQKQIERGEVKLEYSDAGWGYLPSVLNHLGINVDSQIWSFPRRAFSSRRSLPKPRARSTSTTMSRWDMFRKGASTNSHRSIHHRASSFIRWTHRGPRRHDSNAKPTSV